ncbi:hypothetical protein ACS0OX_15240 [Stenotrophomonas pavanii]|uniref:hypothetical protein n=1 Tax=Stenotrophomonas pavanii TaxID=487698 RepID=UPI003F949A82
MDITWEACDSGAGSLDAEVSILGVAAGVQGGFWWPKVASCGVLVVILYLFRRVDSVGLHLGHSVTVVSGWIFNLMLIQARPVECRAEGQHHGHRCSPHHFPGADYRARRA